MPKAMSIVLLVVIGFLLFLLYQNRSLPRIQEATAVIAVVAIGALLVVARGGSLQKSIYSAYFISKKDQVPLFFADTPVLIHHYLFQGAIFSHYQKRLADQKKKTSFDFSSDYNPLIDLQTIAILDHLLKFYRNTWYVKREMKEVASVTMFRGLTIEDVGNDLVKYGKEELPNSLKQNIFFDDLGGSTALALPKGTKIYYTVNKEYPSREFRFHKRLSFDITIKIRYFGGSIGLGSVGDFIGLTNIIEDKYINTSDPNVSNYETICLLIICKAKFSKVRAWNPSVVKYKEWAQNLFDDLYNTFDWSVCEAQMRRHQQTLANQKIIKKLK